MTILSSPIWPSDMTDDRRLIALLGLVQISEDGMGDWLDVLEELAESNVSYGGFIRAGLDTIEDMAGEIERLNALVAMQADLLKRASKSIGAFCGDEGWTQSDMDTLDSVDAAIDATAETVSAWLEKHDTEIRAKMIPSKIVSLQKPYGHPQQTAEQLLDEELVAKGWNMCVDELRAKGE